MPNQNQRGPLPVTTFQDAQGNLVIEGYLLIRLSQDAKAPDNSHICAGRATRTDLDVNAQAFPLLWANSVLTPAGTMYRVDTFTAEDRLVASTFMTALGSTGLGFGVSFGTSFPS